MQKVFISHPYTKDPIRNKQLIDDICRKILSRHDNILPISPIHLWVFMENNKGYRQEILQFCKHMIDGCQEVWVYVYREEISEGQQIELDYAIKQRKTIKFIEID